ncbi:competence/damage-inducible protein A [Caldinitratiruptor microaerophilus]|uniref:Putative competence-damage inducible protein n=1 Tax=Caldinitratiruptor microaerophilus TaxID=671077 RepID=A0AA35G9Q3_9FIRM|nr:competence/damage-inducible protein A [Caldinitratiruptor microaerophilus]BDG60529.1 putative competence-damage inducible protein [Caldinitratiruptor microaerophilus]
MRAELVFVGTELLLGEILNTNAQYLSRRLAELGVDVYYQVTVGDNPERLEGALRQAIGRADVVLTSGGLGPTDDDLTREVAAALSGRPLREDPAVLAEIAAWFERAGRPMTANNRRQAMVPEGATVLPNPVGTAPGLIVPVGEPRQPGGEPPALVLMPGPPPELTRMFEDHVVPYLTRRMGGTPLRLFTRTLRFCGIGESALADAVQDILAAQTDPTIAPYAKPGEVHLRLATKAADAAIAEARFAPVVEAIRQRVGQHLFGTDETTLEQAVGDLLRQRGWTLALAESCTGGLVAKRITDVPGSSAYFLAGYVTYSNAAKMDVLGVPAETLAQHGAVSEATVRAMAEGARRRSGATVAVSVSGIAGPGGGTPEKPVGTVWIGLAYPGGVRARQFLFRGSRDHIRQVTAQYALAYLWAHLREGR